MEAARLSHKENDLRVKFLDEASRYLLIESQSTSSHLMAEKLELGDSKNNSKSTHTCQACGTILIPGLTSQKTTTSNRMTSKIEVVGVGSERRSKQARQLVTSLVEECLTCRRSTNLPLPARNKSRVRKHAGVNKSSISEPKRTELPGATGPPAQTTNRKRKKHKGLLTKSREEEERAKVSSGLDLMDFMKAV